MIAAVVDLLALLMTVGVLLAVALWVLVYICGWYWSQLTALWRPQRLYREHLRQALDEFEKAHPQSEPSTGKRQGREVRC